MSAEKTMVYKLEKSGNIGIGPFKCLGYWVMPSKSLQEHNPSAYNNAWQFAPKLSDGHHNGTCSHCGTGITYNFIVKSADGVISVLGSTCIGKLNYKIKDFDVNERRMRQEIAREKSMALYNQLTELLKREDVVAKLSAQPHPFESFAAEGKTLLDYMIYRQRCSGAAGTKRLLREIHNLMV